MRDLARTLALTMTSALLTMAFGTDSFAQGVHGAKLGHHYRALQKSRARARKHKKHQAAEAAPAPQGKSPTTQSNR